ncbi:MAG: hypothetical protein WCE44_06640 [Candidatus Velthaea sp.]|jgi:hypothetical protein
MSVPQPPYDDLRRTLASDPEALAAVDELHASLTAQPPDAPTIRAHVDRLRGIKDAEARVAGWWESPTVQEWLAGLSAGGL